MNEHNILGAILAGGQSKRMGQDKLLLELNNRKLIEYTIDKVKKYLKKVIIITNQDNEFFNKNNFWDNLFKQFKFFEDEKFSNKNLQNSFHIIDTVDQLKNILIKWQK